LTTAQTVKTYSLGEGKDQKIIEETSSTTTAQVLDNTIDLTTSGFKFARSLEDKNGTSRGSHIAGRANDGIVAFNVSIQMEARHTFAILDHLLPETQWDILKFEIAIEGRGAETHL
jgi:hypothetical protein